LRQCEYGEFWILTQVSASQAPWLGQQAEQPLKSATLHPTRRLRLDTRKKVERRSHAQHDGVNTMAVGVHPTVLLRTPQSYKQNANSGFVDGCDGFLVLL
jgi:hypothetical protein